MKLCIANSELTDSSRGRSVRKITFESDGIEYCTGDHLIVQTMNSSCRITRLALQGATREAVQNIP